MKKRYWLFVVCCFLLLNGCQSNTLVGKFRQRGVTAANTTKLRFARRNQEDQAEVSFVTSEPAIIKAVWDSIYEAKPTKPYKGFLAYYKIEFCISKTENWPAATLRVTPESSVFLESDVFQQYDSKNKQLFMLKCPGLYEICRSNLATKSKESAPAEK